MRGISKTRSVENRQERMDHLCSRPGCDRPLRSLWRATPASVHGSGKEVLFCENSKLIRDLHHNVVIFIPKYIEVITEKSKYLVISIQNFTTFWSIIFVAQKVRLRQPK